MIILERADGQAVLAEGTDALQAGLGGSDRGHHRDPLGEGAGADLYLFAAGHGAGRGIDDEGDFPVFHQINHVGTTLRKLEERGDGNAGIGQLAGGALAGDDPEAEFVETLAETDRSGLVAVADT